MLWVGVWWGAPFASSSEAAASSTASRPALSIRPGLPSSHGGGEWVSPSAARLSQERWIARAPQQTFDLMVLLVEFPEETTDDPMTTGKGRFELEAEENPDYEINLPPHDHAYFGRQCEALNHYVEASSGGNVTFQWNVFPESPDFYEMPHKMRYYNPDTTDDALNTRLAEFFRDAILEADAAGASFAPYDFVVVFHAGVGQDLLINDDTPSDIPSAFLSFEELRDYLDEDETWPGIPVDGGTHHVTEGLWLPETENQDGYEFALTGVFAQLMGSQLGLPILWNPDSGAPGIGRFGLMDQGGGNLLGKAPARPCAWSRLHLGWANALVVTNGADVTVTADSGFAAGVDLIVVPVDEREYFLLEYRKKELNGDGRLEIREDGTVPIEVMGGEYDYGIPGSGLLIWHVDQAVIDAKIDSNRVNADYTHRGVKLMEADGLDDIGLRPEGGFGLAEDAYFRGNNREFTPATTPSSVSNYGADTHVFITGISDTSGHTMSFDVENDVALAGWPDSSVAHYAHSPAAGDVDGDGEIEVVFVDTPRWLTVFGVDGEVEATFELPDTYSLAPRGVTHVLVADLIPDACTECAEIIVGVEAGGVVVYDAAFDPVRIMRPGSDVDGGDPILAMSLDDLGDDGILDLLAATRDSVFVWNDGGEFPGTPFPIPYDGATRYIGGAGGEVADADLLLLGEDGTLLGYSIDALEAAPVGSEPERSLDISMGVRPVTSPVFADLERDGTADIIALAEGGRVTARRMPDGDELPGWPVQVGVAASAPAVGDLDMDGRPDIVIGGNDQVHAFGYNGVRLDNWPVSLTPFDEGGDVLTEPLIADIDGDDRQEVIVASPDGLLRAFEADGRSVDGWPLPAGSRHTVTPIISSAAGGSLWQPGAAGWIYAFGLPGAHMVAHWPQPGGSAMRSGVFADSLLGPPAESSALFPDSRLTVYPNPAYESARFRFFLGEDADVDVRIYDTSGLLVRRLTADAQAGVMNEIVWDLRNADDRSVAPGLYIARVQARSSRTTISREIRLAVIL